MKFSLLSLYALAALSVFSCSIAKANPEQDSRNMIFPAPGCCCTAVESSYSSSSEWQSLLNELEKERTQSLDLFCKTYLKAKKAFVLSKLTGKKNAELDELISSALLDCQNSPDRMGFVADLCGKALLNANDAKGAAAVFEKAGLTVDNALLSAAATYYTVNDFKNGNRCSEKYFAFYRDIGDRIGSPDFSSSLGTAGGLLPSPFPLWFLQKERMSEQAKNQQVDQLRAFLKQAGISQKNFSSSVWKEYTDLNSIVRASMMPDLLAQVLKLGSSRATNVSALGLPMIGIQPVFVDKYLILNSDEFHSTQPKFLELELYYDVSSRLACVIVTMPKQQTKQ